MKTWKSIVSLLMSGPLLYLAVCALSAYGEDPPPPASGGTGAFGIVKIGGIQKMYLPQRTKNAAGHGFVSVVNVGIAGNGPAGAPALITEIDLGGPDFATTTGGDPSIVVAASTMNRTVWFIDPAADKVVGTLQLDPSFFVCLKPHTVPSWALGDPFAWLDARRRSCKRRCPRVKTESGHLAPWPTYDVEEARGRP